MEDKSKKNYEKPSVSSVEFVTEPTMDGTIGSNVNENFDDLFGNDYQGF